ncbi:MAG: protein kinase [Planctomycetes bacterium]|nr:protein kinase [Planctomycetota bacterium]
MKFAHFTFDPVKDLLGEGPLSEVYRALDETLERTVALKILRAHVEIDPEADKRFEREARHTSRLIHPNIATIYEYGSASGRSFIAMEYLQGRTLDKIIRDGQVGAEEGLRIALQLTSALALVHKNGLIHRDLKPANVMVLDDGTVKLLDFGIARANGEATITQHGMLVGTVLYMSPEQVRGEDLAPRSDVFSLGAMLYHALSGQLPFPGNSFPEVCMAILDGKPRPLGQMRRGLPAGIEAFVMRCLSTRPEERYADAEVAHGVLMAFSDSAASGSSTAISATFLSGVLAVPPFTAPGSDERSSAVASSMRKDIAAELARSGMSVTFSDHEPVGPETSSDFVLHGALRLEASRGTLEIVLDRRRGAGAGETAEVWRERIEQEDSDEWSLQARLVRGAVRSLRRQLAEHSLKPAMEPAVRDAEGANLQARKAHEVLHRGMTKHLMASISMFRRALELDSHCAVAYAGLAEGLVRKYLYWDGDESFLAEARDQARRALASDPACAEAHTAIGFAYHLTNHPIDAQREYRLAIQLRNDEWLAHRLLGALLSREGNYKAASPLLQRAIGLRPTYISTYDHLYHVLQRLDRYEEAIGIADRGIAMARKQIQRVPDDQDARVHMATLLARLGQRDEALDLLARAQEIGPKDGFTAFHVATVHAILGNPMESLAALEQAQARGYFVRAEHRNPEFDPLRGMAQFQSLGN